MTIDARTALAKELTTATSDRQRDILAEISRINLTAFYNGGVMPVAKSTTAEAAPEPSITALAKEMATASPDRQRDILAEVSRQNLVKLYGPRPVAVAKSSTVRPAIAKIAGDAADRAVNGRLVR
jgi:hypothetical protein